MVDYVEQRRIQFFFKLGYNVTNLFRAHGLVCLAATLKRHQLHVSSKWSREEIIIIRKSLDTTIFTYAVSHQDPF